MNLISFCFMIFMTSVTGSLVLGIWKLFSLWADKWKAVREIRLGLAVSMLFFILPAAYVYIVMVSGCFLNGSDSILFLGTPFLVKSCRILFLVWGAGIIFKLLLMHKSRRRFKKLLRGSFTAEPRIREMTEALCQKLRIRRKILVYTIPGLEIPAIVGGRKAAVLLPDREYREKEELFYILEHELLHYKHGDLFLKKVCLWIQVFQWFNPLALMLERELDRWCDAFCDLKICYEGGTEQNRKQYFYAVVEGCGEFCRLPVAGMKLKRNSEKDIRERAERMKRYKRKNRMKKSVVILLAVCFMAVSAGTVMAAGQGTEALYSMLYAETDETIAEQPQAQEELEEYIWIPDGNTTVIESGENLNMRSMSTYTWELSAGTMRRTTQFYASAGSKVVITIATDPLNAKTGIGLYQPNGYLRGVSNTGAYSHTFTLYDDGFYRVYARNEGNSNITVQVTVTK